MLAESNFDITEKMASERFFYKREGLRKQKTSELRRDGGTKKRRVAQEHCCLPPLTFTTFSRLKCYTPFTPVTFGVFAVNSDPKGDT